MPYGEEYVGMYHYGDEYTGLEQLVGMNQQLVGRGHYGVYGADAPLAPPGMMHPAMIPNPGLVGRPLMGQLPYSDRVPRLVETQPTNTYEFPLGFRAPNVPPKQAVLVTSQPQVIFRPRRLVIPIGPSRDRIAENFNILDIRIGKDTVFVSAEELPASIFQERAVEVSMGLYTAKVGNTITIAIRNLDHCSSHDFQAVMFGAVAE